MTQDKDGMPVVRVGVLGLGFMGQTHFSRYAAMEGVKVVAVADRNERRLQGDMRGSWRNFGTAADTLDMSGVTGFTDWRELIERTDVDAIDICLPTASHVEASLMSLGRGRHVLCEKPLALSSELARRITDAAGRTPDRFVMPAMCMRFWPGWTWLKRAVDEGAYGKLRSLAFERLTTPPRTVTQAGVVTGGALIDLHIHDTDFVAYLLGAPQTVFSRGRTDAAGEVHHVATHYVYPDVPIVFAEGGWNFSEPFGFRLRYTANWERATADYDLSRDQPLLLHADGKTTSIPCPDPDGWAEQLRYFVECVRLHRPPSIVTAHDGVRSLEILEAEVQSIQSGKPVAIRA